MACTDLDRADVAVLDLGERRLRIYHVLRDRTAEAAILDRLAVWWERYVVRREPPSDDGAAALARWPREQSADLVPAEPEALFWLDTLRRARDERKRLEEAEAEAADALKALIGPAAGIDGGAAGRVTWKATADRKAVDWQAVARACGATPEQIAAHMTMKAGTRRFVPTWPGDKQITERSEG